MTNMSIEEIKNFLLEWGIKPVSPVGNIEKWAETQLPDFSVEEIKKVGDPWVDAITDEELEKTGRAFYDYVTRTGYDNLFMGNEIDNLSRKILAVLERMNGAKRVLDIGCGHGIYGLAFAQIHPDASVHGVDLSPEKIKIARERAERKNLKNLVFSEGSFFRVPAPNGEFDTVLAIAVLHEADKPERYMFGGVYDCPSFNDSDLYRQSWGIIHGHLGARGKVVISLPTLAGNHEYFKEVLPEVVQLHGFEIRDDMKSIEYTNAEKKGKVIDLVATAYKKD